MFQWEVVPAAHFCFQDRANESSGLQVHRKVEGYAGGHSCHLLHSRTHAFRQVNDPV